MGIFRKTSTYLAALCVSVAAQATTEWSTFIVEHNKISVRAVYPSQSNAMLVKRLITGVKTALVEVEKKNQGSFESSFEVIFDDNPIGHNGVATVIPRNFIWIYTVPPDNNDSIGVTKNYLQSTLNHEFAHMFYLQKRRGIFRLGHKIFGNLSSPLGSWPRWMQEGWASWVEQRFDKNENISYLNFLKRSYALAVSENPKERLTTSMLEGNYTLNAVSPGEIPYAFGYGMIEKIFSHVSPEKWADNSAASLGIGFRKDATANGFSMETLFEQNEKEWHSVPLNSPEKIVREIFRQQNIYGLSDQFVIASNDDGMRVIDFKSPESPQEYTWRMGNWYLNQIISSDREGVVVAAYYTMPSTGRAPSPLKIALFKQNVATKTFDSLCTVFDSTSESIENLFLQDHQVYATLVSRLPQGDDTSPKEKVIRVSKLCSEPTTEISMAPQMFQRGFDTTTWYLQSKNKQPFGLSNLISPRLENQKLCAQVFATNVEWCASAIHSTENSRNSILIAHAPSGALLFKVVSAITGAQETSLSTNGFTWIEKRWKHDLLNQISLTDLSRKPTQIWNDFAPPTKQIESESEKPNNDQTYSPWSTLLPHYWMPQLFASNNGMVVGGRAWFQDITKTYEGALGIGFDTFSNRPYASTYVQRKIEWGSLAKSAGLRFSYHRDANLSTKVDVASTEFGINGSQIFGSSHSIATRFALSHRWTSINGLSKRFVIPAVGVSWRYREAPLTNGLNVDHSKHRFGYVLAARFSWLNNYETYAESGLSGAFPLSWLLHVEYGNTSAKNLPYSYFQWGGYYPLNLFQSTFLSRGFAPLSAPAINIGRAAFTTGWKWSEHIAGIGWSRFSVERITQDVFAESVSFERAFDTTHTKLGNRFYSTIGSELNFWTRSLFYVKSRAFVGLYQGFGIGAETRVAIGLASNLDI